jgi:hypothetical protein
MPCNDVIDFHRMKMNLQADQYTTTRASGDRTGDEAMLCSNTGDNTVTPS